MAISEAQRRAVAKYNAKSYDRFEVKVYKGKKALLQDIAKGQGKSLNLYVREALIAKVKEDTGKEIKF